MSTRKRIGFIGLGLMGEPMAEHILKAGHQLRVYNRTKEKTNRLLSLGSIDCRTPEELADQSDIVITMVTGPEDVSEVLFGTNGVVKAASTPSIVIDMSTIGPAAAKKIGSDLSKRGIFFADAPVTGGTYAAQSGTLTIFVGTDKKTYARIRPVLKSMGKRIYRLGEIGAGQAVKMINNYIIASSMVSLSEGMLLADAMGLDRADAARVLSHVPATSPMMRKKIGNYVSGTYPMNFTIRNMAKDLGLAAGSMPAGKRLKVLRMIANVYKSAAEGSFAGEDYSRIIDSLEF